MPYRVGRKKKVFNQPQKFRIHESEGGLNTQWLRCYMPIIYIKLVSETEHNKFIEFHITRKRINIISAIFWDNFDL
jgi:hypothetical protein